MIMVSFGQHCLLAGSAVTGRFVDEAGPGRRLQRALGSKCSAETSIPAP